MGMMCSNIRTIDLHENFAININKRYNLPKSEDITKYYCRDAELSKKSTENKQKLSSYYILMEKLKKIKNSKNPVELSKVIPKYLTVDFLMITNTDTDAVKRNKYNIFRNIIERSSWLYVVLLSEYCRYLQLTMSSQINNMNELLERDNCPFTDDVREDLCKIYHNKRHFGNVNLERYGYLKINSIVFNHGPLYDSLSYMDRCSLFERSKTHQTIFDLKDKLAELIAVLCGNDPSEIKEGIKSNLDAASRESGKCISYRDYCEAMLGLYGNPDYKTVKYLVNITPELDEFLYKHRDNISSSQNLIIHGKNYSNVKEGQLDRMLDTKIYILINDLANFILDKIMMDVECYKRRYKNNINNGKISEYTYATGTGIITSRGMASMVIQNPYAIGTTEHKIEIEFPKYHIVGSHNISFDISPEEYNSNIDEYPMKYIFREYYPVLKYSFVKPLVE